MATAFTMEERERIKERLLDAALRCASGMGMRHTTVDGLARQASISKGAFYSFYGSKELLFLDMVESIHREMYGNAERVLTENAALPLRERVTMAIFEVYRVARERNVIPFMREETPILLRKLPEEQTRQLYHSDDEYIRRLIQKTKAELATSMDTVCALVRLLLMTLLVKDDVGNSYDEAVRLMIAGSCDQAIKA